MQRESGMSFITGTVHWQMWWYCGDTERCVRGFPTRCDV